MATSKFNPQMLPTLVERIQNGYDMKLTKEIFWSMDWYPETISKKSQIDAYLGEGKNLATICAKRDFPFHQKGESFEQIMVECFKRLSTIEVVKIFNKISLAGLYHKIEFNKDFIKSLNESKLQLKSPNEIKSFGWKEQFRLMRLMI